MTKFIMYCYDDYVRDIEAGVQTNRIETFYNIVIRQEYTDRWGQAKVYPDYQVIGGLTKADLDNLLDAITGPAELQP